jgi:hypothetical protein
MQSRNAQVNCEVHVLPSGERIDGKPNHAMNTYNYGSRKGVTLMEFDAAHDATYTLDCQATGEMANLKPSVAIGGGTSKGIRTMFIRSFVLVMVGLTVALLAFLRVSMLRLKSRNEIRERGLRPV